MAHAYLGILSARGLELLVPETEHALAFLLRRAYRRRPHKLACCWAVMPEDAASGIHMLISAGLYEQAFLALNAESLEIGTIPPDYPAGEMATRPA